MTRSSFESWVQEQERLHLNLKKIASFEEKTKPEQELMSVVVIDAHCLVKSDYPRLKPLANILGEIPAL